MASTQEISLQVIAHIRTPFRQKFAIPRQPNLARHAIGEIVFEPAFSDPNALRDLSGFSHAWLIFWFHQSAGSGWSPMVQPPRLGGKQRVGVFASRSMFRPNPIGMSVVELLDWQQQGSQLLLRVGGVDLLDGTPILDIKPYVPYADSIVTATGGYAAMPPCSAHQVVFSESALEDLAAFTTEYPHLKQLISEVLGQDPRPAYRRQPGDSKRYGMSLFDLNIKWQPLAEGFEVLSVKRHPDSGSAEFAGQSGTF
jgi:tRNA (adenine37-N6)-methyltransferase